MKFWDTFLKLLKKPINSKGSKEDAAPISIFDCLLELYRIEYPTEYTNFQKSTHMSSVIKGRLTHLIIAQMALKVLYKYVAFPRIDTFDIKKYISHQLRPYIKQFMHDGILSYSAVAKDAYEALHEFDLNELNITSDFDEEDLDRFLNANLLNEDGSFNSSYRFAPSSKDIEETSDSVSENKPGETFPQMPKELFDKVLTSVIEINFKPHFSDRIEWRNLEIDLITDYFLELFRDNYFARLRMSYQPNDNPKFSDADLLILIETRMISGVRHKGASNSAWTKSLHQGFVDKRLKPKLKKIADAPGSELTLIARDAVMGFNLTDLEGKKVKVRKREPSPPLWLIISLISIIIIFKVVGENLDQSNVIFFTIFAIIIFFALVGIAQTQFDEKTNVLVGDVSAEIVKVNTARKKFLSTNLLEYCHPSMIEKFLVTESEKPPEDTPLEQGKDLKPKEEEASINKPDYPLPEETAIEGNRNESGDEPLSPFERPQTATGIRDLDYKDNLHANIDSEKSVPFPQKTATPEKTKTEPPPPVPEEKKEYKVYSHKFPNGTKLTIEKLNQAKIDYEKSKGNYLFFIQKIGKKYFNEGNPIQIPIVSIKALKAVLESSPNYVSHHQLHYELTGNKYKGKKLGKNQMEYIYRAFSDLYTATLKKLKVCIETDPNEGYKFSLLEGLKFFLVENLPYHQ